MSGRTRPARVNAALAFILSAEIVVLGGVALYAYANSWPAGQGQPDAQMQLHEVATERSANG